MSLRAIDIDGLARPQKTDPGRPPQLDWLPIDRLVIDPDYQRRVQRDGRRAIEHIASNFCWAKFSAVVVAPVINERFAIIDGQHRTTAAKLCGYDRVPCLIQALDRAGQASSFAAINGTVTKVSPWVLYRAALTAGEDWAVQAKRVTDAAGVVLMVYQKQPSARLAGELYGIGTIRDMITKHGEAAVTLALAAYRQSPYGDLALAWGNVFVWAWISAVAAVPEDKRPDVAALAAFHEDFDILAADDQVQAAQRQARRDGKPTLAHWAALSAGISEALAGWLEARSS